VTASESNAIRLIEWFCCEYCSTIPAAAYLEGQAVSKFFVCVFVRRESVKRSGNCVLVFFLMYMKYLGYCVKRKNQITCLFTMILPAMSRATHVS